MTSSGKTKNVREADPVDQEEAEEVVMDDANADEVLDADDGDETTSAQHKKKAEEQEYDDSEGEAGADADDSQMPGEGYSHRFH